jgi:hypothetical protein
MSRKMKIIDLPPGMVAQIPREAAMDDEGATLALVRLNKDGRVSVNWSPILFNEAPMPDELREMLVAVLRQHADGLESREFDKLVKEVQPLVDELMKAEEAKN